MTYHTPYGREIQRHGVPFRVTAEDWEISLALKPGLLSARPRLRVCGFFFALFSSFTPTGPLILMSKGRKRTRTPRGSISTTGNRISAVRRMRPRFHQTESR
jgi:hypothetical protein